MTEASQVLEPSWKDNKIVVFFFLVTILFFPVTFFFIELGYCLHNDHPHVISSLFMFTLLSLFSVALPFIWLFLYFLGSNRNIAPPRLASFFVRGAFASIYSCLVSGFSQLFYSMFTPNILILLSRFSGGLISSSYGFMWFFGLLSFSVFFQLFFVWLFLAETAFNLLPHRDEGAQHGMIFGLGFGFMNAQLAINSFLIFSVAKFTNNNEDDLDSNHLLIKILESLVYSSFVSMGLNILSFSWFGATARNHLNINCGVIPTNTQVIPVFLLRIVFFMIFWFPTLHEYFGTQIGTNAVVFFENFVIYVHQDKEGPLLVSSEFIPFSLPSLSLGIVTILLTISVFLYIQRTNLSSLFPLDDPPSRSEALLDFVAD